MTAFMPHDFANGELANGTKVRECLEAFEDRVPLEKDDISDAYARDVVWDVPLQLSAFSSALANQDSPPPTASPPFLGRWKSNVALTSALSESHSRAYACSAFDSGERRNIGFLHSSYMAGRFVILQPDKFGGSVIMRTYEDGLTGMEIATLADLTPPSDYTPFAATAMSNGDIYALCEDAEGKSAVVRFSTGSGEVLASAGTSEDPLDIRANGLGTHVYWVDMASGDSGRRQLNRLAVPVSLDSPEPDRRSFLSGIMDGLTGKVGTEQAGALVSTSIEGGSSDHIRDFVMTYPFQENPIRSAVLMLYEDVANSTHRVIRLEGDELGASPAWNSTESGVTVVSNPLNTATLDPKCMIEIGTNVLVVGDDGINTVHWALYPACSVNRTFSDALLSGSQASLSTVVQASACTDGEGAYMLLQDGCVLHWNPNSNTVQAIIPRDDFDSVSPELGSNVVFTGRGLAAHLSVSGADGNSCVFQPW